MKFNERDYQGHLFGIELIPETERESKLLKRFWDGGVNLNAYNGRDLTLSFGDLVKSNNPARVPSATRKTPPIATPPTLQSIRELATPLSPSDATTLLTHLLMYDKYAHVENVISDIIARAQKSTTASVDDKTTSLG